MVPAQACIQYTIVLRVEMSHEVDLSVGSCMEVLILESVILKTYLITLCEPKRNQ